MRPVRADIDLSAISDNVRTLTEIAGVPVCAVVKADGYGHGAVSVARAALDGGAGMLAVALVAEGAELRDAQIGGPILVLSEPSPDEFGDAVDADLDVTVYTEAGIDALRHAAAAAEHSDERPIAAHLKIDTGMHRVGVASADAVDLARRIDDAPELRLASVFTHFAVADRPDDPRTRCQLELLLEAVAAIESAGIDVPMRHAANTAAAIGHPETRLDLVRCGIGIYGLSPGSDVDDSVPLRPALSLRATVSHTRRIAAGDGVSYGHRWTAPRDTRIATVPIGYADGVPRSLGLNGGRVLIGGRSCPIAGVVTMDQLVVDCDDLDVDVGDEVVLIGTQGDEHIDAEEWAERTGTINYEIVCGIGPRVRRRHH